MGISVNNSHACVSDGTEKIKIIIKMNEYRKYIIIIECTINYFDS